MSQYLGPGFLHMRRKYSQATLFHMPRILLPQMLTAVMDTTVAANIPYVLA